MNYFLQQKLICNATRLKLYCCFGIASSSRVACSPLLHRFCSTTNTNTDSNQTTEPTQPKDEISLVQYETKVYFPFKYKQLPALSSKKKKNLISKYYEEPIAIYFSDIHLTEKEVKHIAKGEEGEEKRTITPAYMMKKEEREALNLSSKSLLQLATTTTAATTTASTTTNNNSNDNYNNNNTNTTSGNSSNGSSLSPLLRRLPLPLTIQLPSQPTFSNNATTTTSASSNSDSNTTDATSNSTSENDVISKTQISSASVNFFADYIGIASITFSSYCHLPKINRNGTTIETSNNKQQKSNNAAKKGEDVSAAYTPEMPFEMRALHPFLDITWKLQSARKQKVEAVKAKPIIKWIESDRMDSIPTLAIAHPFANNKVKSDNEIHDLQVVYKNEIFNTNIEELFKIILDAESPEWEPIVMQHNNYFVFSNVICYPPRPVEVPIEEQIEEKNNNSYSNNSDIEELDLFDNIDHKVEDHELEEQQEEIRNEQRNKQLKTYKYDWDNNVMSHITYTAVNNCFDSTGLKFDLQSNTISSFVKDHCFLDFATDKGGIWIGVTRNGGSALHFRNKLPEAFGKHSDGGTVHLIDHVEYFSQSEILAQLIHPILYQRAFLQREIKNVRNLINQTEEAVTLKKKHSIFSELKEIEGKILRFKLKFCEPLTDSSSGNELSELWQKHTDIPYLRSTLAGNISDLATFYGQLSSLRQQRKLDLLTVIVGVLGLGQLLLQVVFHEQVYASLFVVGCACALGGIGYQIFFVSQNSRVLNFLEQAQAKLLNKKNNKVNKFGRIKPKKSKGGTISIIGLGLLICALTFYKAQEEQIHNQLRRMQNNDKEKAATNVAIANSENTKETAQKDAIKVANVQSINENK